MDRQEETRLIPREEAQEALPQENPQGGKGIVRTAKDFMNGVLSPLKGKDMGQMVEEFTAEMTLVIEGLSEDQEKLARQTDRLDAQQTQLEQRLIDEAHDLNVALDESKKELAALKGRLDKLEKQSEKGKKGVTAALRQATWLVGIAVIGWIVVTVINLFK
ncbi:MAG: hypothetical protein J5472_03805 [Clostridia bacterium]|nr:hypothetical protein [Clostridia bacterium]